jgi:hypothetical protein
MGEEYWKPITGYEGFYEVSDRGRVRSCARAVRGPHNSNRSLMSKIIVGSSCRGYHQVLLHRLGTKRTRRVHALMMEAFVGPRPNGAEINHKDGKKRHNYIGNLEYCTRRENNVHALRTGLRVNVKGERHGRARLVEKQVIEIRSLVAAGELQKNVAVRFGISKQAICKIVNRQKWQHV